MTLSYPNLAGVTVSPRISGLKTTMTTFWYRDCFNATTCANPDGWGNKLVAIFFLPGPFYRKPILSLIWKFLHAGS